MNLLLTGSTSGIGWEKLKALYPYFDQIILPVRNIEKAKLLLNLLPDQKKIHLIELDLADLKSVEKGARLIAENFPTLDVLINNAGGMFQNGKRTSEGLDQSFVVNHLGPMLLTKTLIPNILAAKGKIIFVSSEAHRFAQVDPSDFGQLRNLSSFQAYSNVKLYNILTSRFLANRYQEQGLTSYSLHPGIVRTAFGSDSSPLLKALIRTTQLFFISPQKGAKTGIFLANTPSSGLKNGGYYVRNKAVISSKTALDRDLGENLWKFSEEILFQVLS
jgi:NAD(P)-dependent dehydrogenase (short-subunit alcohol dehydrogenase family)